jgi:carotenoid cleavage dioxygenase
MVKAHTIYNDFAAVSRPFRAEAGIEDVEVEGEIPKEVNGTFYRVGYTVCSASVRPPLTIQCG